MKKLTVLIAAVVFAVPSWVLACDKHQHAEAEKLKLIHVAELQKAIQTEHPVIFDANSTQTRQKEGVIPGAVLLTSSSKYDIARELPAKKDSELVFYCANEKCMASHKAAERASAAGYSHVSVFADGIQGWKSAGQKTSVPRS